MCNNKIYKRIIFNYRHWEIFSNGIIYCLKKQKNLNNNFTNWNERGRKKKKEEEVKRILGILFNERSKVPIQTVSKGEPLPVSITVSGYRFKRSTARGQNYQRKNFPNNVQREREKTEFTVTNISKQSSIPRHFHDLWPIETWISVNIRQNWLGISGDQFTFLVRNVPQFCQETDTPEGWSLTVGATHTARIGLCIYVAILSHIPSRN